MHLFRTMAISGSALTAERLRLDIIANNLANANTTRTAAGGPFRRQVTVFAPRGDETQFLYPGMGTPAGAFRGRGVRVAAVSEDPSPFKRVYDPGHPDADASGYVSLPNVNVVTEMVDMLAAQRAYEANVSAIVAARTMAERALDIGRA
ncbi:MAG: flagellar basal body rod protein FlgC [bacterium]